MTKRSGLLVIAETAEDSPVPLTYELLGLARLVGQALQGEVAVALLGYGIGGHGRDLIAFGADRVYVLDDPIFAEYQADAWMPDLVKIIEESSPAAVFIGHSAMGADLAPRLAFRLESAVAMGCVEVQADAGKLLLTRPCYGGNAREVVSFKTVPAIGTIRARSYDCLERDDSREGQVVEFESTLASSDVRTKICDRQLEGSEGPRLENADAVVAGGRGLNGPVGFALAERLADLLGGAVGASRVACDLGWCPPSYQIGLSGRTVAPELYVALGISGAGQHMSGCAGAKSIVAINSDPDAEIFNWSRFGIVGDCAQILPALIKEIEKRKSQR